MLHDTDDSHQLNFLDIDSFNISVWPQLTVWRFVGKSVASFTGSKSVRAWQIEFGNFRQSKHSVVTKQSLSSVVHRTVTATLTSSDYYCRHITRLSIVQID